MTAGTKVIGYVRVSTAEQGSKGVSLEAQEQALRAECERRGWELVRIVQDVASGAKVDRPGLNEAIAAVASGEAAGLIVTKLDRLSRDVADFATMLKRFTSKGWALVVLDLGIDTTTIMGAGMAHVAATFAQMERERIGERIREALAVKRAHGVQLGRPRSMDVKVRRRILRERKAGKSLRAIAEGLNADAVPTAHDGTRWHASTVRAVAISA